MPEITNIHEWQNWRMGAGKQENILDNINTHRSLLHQIFNIAVNRFTWEGLPEGLPSNKIEEWLLTRGSVGAFPSDIGNIIVPITHGGINIYGQPTFAYPVYNSTSFYNDPNTLESEFNTTYPKADHSRGVICWANSLHDTDFPTIDFYCEKLTHLQRSIDIVALQLRMPRIFWAEETEVNTFNKIQTQIEQGKPIIILEKDFTLINGDPDKVLETPTNGGNINYLWDSYFKAKNELYQFLGMPYNEQRVKKAQVNTKEITVNDIAISAMNDQQLYERERFCEKCNKELNMNISVKKTYDLNLMATEEANNRVEEDVY